MLKPALVALALLACSPAYAETIYIDLNPYVLSQEPQYAYEYFGLLKFGAYNLFPGIPFYDVAGCPCVFSPFRLAEIDNAFYSAFPGDNVIFFMSSGVPEPATWALMLFGFAFFALKGIWPRRHHG